MRIATWNLERGRTKAAVAAQHVVLREVGANVAVLTEPPRTYVSEPGCVVSPALRDGPGGLESWIAIVGPAVEPCELEIPYEHLAVAARVPGDPSVIIYGTVLPWLAVCRHAPYLVRPGEGYADVFARILDAQRRDLARLGSQADILVWAGDFNQSLDGPVRGASQKGREAVQACLDELGLTAWNATAPHAREGLCAIDLICGPAEHIPRAQGRIPPEHDDVRMSDHAGYWVDL